MTSAELTKVARAELTPILAAHGFRRTPRSSKASWAREQDGGWLIVWFQSSSWNGAGAGFEFTVEMAVFETLDVLYGGQRLFGLLTHEEREELRELENRVKAKLPPPPDWALERPGSAYLAGWEARDEPYEGRDDIWFRYWDEEDVTAELDFIGRVLPAAIDRFLHLRSLDEPAAIRYLEEIWSTAQEPVDQPAAPDTEEDRDPASLPWLLDRLAIAPDPRERGMTAIQLGFSEDRLTDAALLRALDGDPDPNVRFTAAEALVTQRSDPTCFPAIARFMRQMVELGTRDALDPVAGCAGVVAQFETHARLGFHPSASDELLEPVRVALRAALELAERLRSRQRRALADGLAAITGGDAADGAPEPVSALAARVPADLWPGGAEIASGTGTQWGDARLNRALRGLGLRPRDVEVVSGHARQGPGVMVVVWGVPGCDPAALAAAFEAVVTKPVRRPWELRTVGDRAVRWMVGRDWTTAWWPATVWSSRSAVTPTRCSRQSSGSHDRPLMIGRPTVGSRRPSQRLSP